MVTSPGEGASEPTEHQVLIEVVRCLHRLISRTFKADFALRKLMIPLLMSLSMFCSRNMVLANQVSGAASDTTSLVSSVSKYRFENGRRYHGYKDGSYLLVLLILTLQQ